MKRYHIYRQVCSEWRGCSVNFHLWLCHHHDEPWTWPLTQSKQRVIWELTAIPVVPLIGCRRRGPPPLGQHRGCGNGQQQQQHTQFGGHDQTSTWEREREREGVIDKRQKSKFRVFWPLLAHFLVFHPSTKSQSESLLVLIDQSKFRRLHQSSSDKLTILTTCSAPNNKQTLREQLVNRVKNLGAKEPEISLWSRWRPNTKLKEKEYWKSIHNWWIHTVNKELLVKHFKQNCQKKTLSVSVVCCITLKWPKNQFGWD